MTRAWSLPTPGTLEDLIPRGIWIMENIAVGRACPFSFHSLISRFVVTRDQRGHHALSSGYAGKKHFFRGPRGSSFRS